jgi:hypothetical protein
LPSPITDKARARTHTRTRTAYNFAELNTTSLVLTSELIALILTNQITMWNDTRIKAVNTDVAALLPAHPITVIVENVTSVQLTYTRWLNDTVSWWGSQVRSERVSVYTSVP